MSLVCSLSNETPEVPVISPVSGHVFEKRLLLKYLVEHGCDPINEQPLAPEQIISLKTSSFVLPKPPSATSIPAILKAMQDEWDAVMLQSFTLRRQLQTARQELSHALYQHDAACRVIARLTKEVTAAREALATLKPHTGVVQANQAVHGQVIRQDATEKAGADNNVQEEIGISDEVIGILQKQAAELTAERKRRGKTVPEGLAKAKDISQYKTLHSHTGIHSSSMPGIVCLDVCKSRPERIVTGGNDKNAVVFDINSAKVMSVLSGHAKKVSHVVYHASEQLVFTGSPDCTVRVWGVEQGQCASVLRAHSAPITGLSSHATGNYILSSSADGQWAFSDIRKGKVLVRVSATDKSGSVPALTCAQFHPDGLILGTGTSDGEVKIWDVKERRNVANFGHGFGSGQEVTALAFSENGYFLATGGNDGQIKLWDLRKLKNFKTLIPEEDYNQPYEINSLEFDNSGTYLAVCGSDVRVYLCKQWDELNTFTNHTATATGVRFGQMANTILSSSLDRSIKIYGLSESEGIPMDHD